MSCCFLFTYFSTAPSSFPSNITHELLNDTTLNYYWDEPACGSRGGVISVYEYAFGLNGGQTTYGSTGSDPDDRVATFYDLDYFKDYKFEIRANTSAGAGPYSKAIVVKTPESCKS